MEVEGAIGKRGFQCLRVQLHARTLLKDEATLRVFHPSKPTRL